MRIYVYINIIDRYIGIIVKPPAKKCKINISVDILISQYNENLVFDNIFENHVTSYRFLFS